MNRKRPRKMPGGTSKRAPGRRVLRSCAVSDHFCRNLFGKIREICWRNVRNALTGARGFYRLRFVAHRSRERCGKGGKASRRWRNNPLARESKPITPPLRPQIGVYADRESLNGASGGRKCLKREREQTGEQSVARRDERRGEDAV